jgi:sugar O-acyltransferase (sialic acid O-acetyltransferase NeuD family)
MEGHFSLPNDCRRIIIVGAGGFGREVLHWSSDAWPDHRERIAGFLSKDPNRLDGISCRLPILGSPESFEPETGDGFVLAIGIPGTRRRVAEVLLSKGCRFLSVIHPTAIVAPTAVIETGAVICPYAIVSDSVRVGRFALLNYHSSLGHDASVGDFAVLSPYATLGGGARVEDEVFLGLNVAVAPNVVLGSRTRVSAGAVAMRDAPVDSLIYGVPGRSSKCIAVS